MTTTTKEVAQVELSSQVKAELDEMIKDAKNSCHSKEIVNRFRAMAAEYNDQKPTEVAGITPFILVEGALKSQTQGPLTVFYSNIWFGHIVKDYPNPVEGLINVFGQGCYTYDGIKAAVIYSGENSAGVECGWLVAWQDCNMRKKIYAECGHISKFNNMDWNRIDSKLEGSGLIPYVHASDSETRTSVYATITWVDSYSLMEVLDTLVGIFNG